MSDLNVSVASYEMMVDSMVIIPVQQINLFQETQGLTLFRVELNIGPLNEKENVQCPPAGDTGRNNLVLGLNEVAVRGTRSDAELVMGQQTVIVFQGVSLVQTASGPLYVVCEWHGLGSDPFNLMPIIEHHQKVRKMK